MGTWITGSVDVPPEPVVIAHSEIENYSSDAWTANVLLESLWENRHATIENILVNGLSWPYRPDAGMRAISGSVQSVAGAKTSTSSGLHVYDKARIQVNFQKFTNDVGVPGGGEGDALYYETIEANGEMLKMPPEQRPVAGEDGGWFFSWDEASGQVISAEEAPSRLLIGLDYVVKWLGLSSIPVAAINLVDHVNSDEVVSPSLGLTFPIGTLLFNAPVISRTVTSGYLSTNKFDMEARWSYRKDGWNKFFDPKTGTFKKLWLHYYGDDPADPIEFDPFPTSAMSGLLP